MSGLTAPDPASTIPRVERGLSVAIACRNNERTIGRTLESVRGLAAEIVAVDSGSTDGTIGILEAHGARIIRSEWLGYGPTKQLAAGACRGEWILHLDSDESLEDDLREAVRRAIGTTDGAVSGWWVNRRVWHRGRPLRHALQPEWRLRLARRGSASWQGLEPHPSLVMLDGRAGTSRLGGHLRHDAWESFEAQGAKALEHARSAAAAMRAAGVRGSVGRLLTAPLSSAMKHLVLKRAWLDGAPGVMAAYTMIVYTTMKHLYLLERTMLDDEAHEGPK